MAAKPTLKSIAQSLGLHHSLISRVLRGTADVRVSPEKRRLILQTAHEVGYRPNRMGSSLRSQASQVVALLTPDITNPFHSRLFSGAEKAARLAGYDLLLCHVSDHRDSTDLADAVTRGLVDGVLVACAWQPDPRLALLREAQLPYVLINRPSGDPQELQFLPDDEATGLLAAQALAERGHQRILAIFSDMRMGSMRRRCDAFVRHLHALAPRTELTIRDNMNSAAALRQVIADMAGNAILQRPTAVFVPHSQYTAIVVEEVSIRHGLRVPQEVSILGYGAEPASALSAVCVPAETMGAEGMEALLRLIRGEPAGPSKAYAPVLNAGLTLGPPGG